MSATTDGRLSGDDFYIEFDGVVLRSSGKSVDIDHQGKSSDGTTFGDSYETTIPTKKSLKVSGEFVVFTKVTNGAQQRNAFTIHKEANLLWGPEGKATGKPKGGAVMRIAKATEKYKAGDAAVWSVEWEMAGGALLFDPKLDTWA
jgi:hypothetical protein